MRRSVAASALGLVVLGGAALAQQIDPRRPETVVVGLPLGPSPMARVDARRTGQATSALPTAPLKVAWKKPVSQRPIEHAPLALSASEILVVTVGGEAVWLDAEAGTERNRVSLSTGATGAPAVLANGTVVVVASNAVAVGFKSDGVKFKTSIGSHMAADHTIAPLALPDGGVVVATSTELAVLDGAGGIRARAEVPESISGPLVAARGKIFCIGTSGVVYGWVPGREPQRVGSFGGLVDGGAAIVGDRTLVAMVDPSVQSRLVALDVETGVAIPRATFPQAGLGAYLGPPAVLGDVVYGLSATINARYVVALDAAGQEKMRVPIPASAALPTPLGDAGAAVFTVPAHTGVIVDRGGTVAFAAPDGTVGIVDRGGALSITGNEMVCKSQAKVSGIAPAGPGAFVVSCTSGVVARVITGT